MIHRIYNEHASWFELLTVPASYDDEAEIYRHALIEGAVGDVHEVMELGAGGGNIAVHLKQHFGMTLVDLSPDMLQLARRRNPECQHAAGDMRSVRLGRRFDAVFVHDAITYMTTIGDLRAALETTFVHCRPGGAGLWVPKFLREGFKPTTRHGGTDAPGDDGRAMRYLHWCTDPDPSDTHYTVLLTCVFRDRDGTTHVDSEEHTNGLFSRATWRELVMDVGFEAPQIRPVPGATMVLARRPQEGVR